MTARSITVWTVAPDAAPAELWPRLEALLDDDERTRAARFFFEHHRRQHVAAHALKRLMLSVFGTSPPAAWRFDVDPGGKPRVVNAHGLCFNLSHCDGLVACAMSQDGRQLGIDVERLTAGPPLEIVETRFAPAEQHWLRGLRDTAQALGFFRLWTLKEAFVKATGSGLAQPLQDFAFGFDPLRVAFHNPALGDPKAWHFEQRLICTDHLVALAWSGPHSDTVSVTMRNVDFETLLAIVHRRYCLRSSMIPARAQLTAKGDPGSRKRSAR